MALFSESYSPDFAEIESLQLAVRQGLRVEEVPVRMLERAGGSSFLTPLRSAFFIFKGLIVLMVGQFRPRRVGGRSDERLAARRVADDPKVHLTSQTRILAAVLAIAFMAMILELIRRDRLQERYSVVWFVAGLGMLVGAAFPGLLERRRRRDGRARHQRRPLLDRAPAAARPGAQLQRDHVAPGGADHPPRPGAGARTRPRAGGQRAQRRTPSSERRAASGERLRVERARRR